MPRVHADVVGAYDFDEDLAFPSLSSPDTDPDTGTFYPTYGSWLDSHAFLPPLGGDLIIDSDTESFSYSDPTGRGRITWDAATETLTIDGVIKVEGQVKMGKIGPPGGGLLTAIKYQGTGAIYATDKIEIHKDLYPSGRFLADGPGADFVHLWHVPRAGTLFPLGMPTGGMTSGISGMVRDWYENR